MFPRRYFPREHFAPRYFPVGAGHFIGFTSDNDPSTLTITIAAPAAVSFTSSSASTLTITIGAVFAGTVQPVTSVSN